jgi:hypothetical protein
MKMYFSCYGIRYPFLENAGKTVKRVFVSQFWGSVAYPYLISHKKQKRDTKERVPLRSRDDILETLSRMSTELRSTFKVKRIGLFGSYARQEQRPDSDIDLLVDFSEDADLFDLVELKYFLEEKLHNPVDIVPERALRDELRQSVIADVSYV